MRDWNILLEFLEKSNTDFCGQKSLKITYMRFLKLVIARSSRTLDEMVRKAATPAWKKDLLSEYSHLPGKSRKEFLDNRLEEFLGHIKANAKYRGDRLVVYRCLNATVDEFLDSERVGDHWTYDGGNVGCWEQDSSSKSKWIVLEGTIALKDIDLNETMWTNVSFEDETEVTLKGGKSAAIDMIVSFKDRKKVLKKFSPPLVKRN